MKLFNSISLFILLPTLAQAQGSGVRFDTQSSWQQIKDQAKTENKYIFLDFFATWCGPCKMMDRDVYSNDTVAQLMNQKVIAVRVQMDSTANDDTYVRSWRSDAGMLGKTYKVAGYPSYLVFSPQGLLVDQELGYKPVAEFTTMIGQATDPQRVLLYQALDDYKSGKRDYAHMPELLAFARDVVKDKDLVKSIAKAYKMNYLDKLPAAELCTTANLDFIGNYVSLVGLQDGFFKLCYDNPVQVDSFKGKGFAAWFTGTVITLRELDDKLVRDGKPILKDPDWQGLTTTIATKYPAANAKELVLQYQLSYYWFYDKNWRTWVGYQEKYFRLHPPQNAFFDLNMPAWNTFLACNDPVVLKKALSWSEQSIKMDGDHPDVQCLDTRANLLYKLGRKKEAIEQEKQAIRVSTDIGKSQGNKGPYLDEFAATLTKMQNNQPTWQDN